MKILDEEGAPLLAGSDTVGSARVVAGASLHDEFVLLDGDPTAAVANCTRSAASSVAVCAMTPKR